MTEVSHNLAGIPPCLLFSTPINDSVFLSCHHGTIKQWESVPASARLRRIEQWLLYELRHGRAERRLLERLIYLKEEDLDYQRNRLMASQEQVSRLRRELGECRSELLDRQKQYIRIFVDNIRLQADNSELRFHLRQVGVGCSYRSSHEKKFWIQYADTAL